jgi:hypothetical protein
MMITKVQGLNMVVWVGLVLFLSEEVFQNNGRLSIHPPLSVLDANGIRVPAPPDLQCYLAAYRGACHPEMLRGW